MQIHNFAAEAGHLALIKELEDVVTKGRMKPDTLSSHCSCVCHSFIYNMLISYQTLWL